jgi:hypothetical protein
LDRRVDLRVEFVQLALVLEGRIAGSPDLFGGVSSGARGARAKRVNDLARLRLKPPRLGTKSRFD